MSQKVNLEDMIKSGMHFGHFTHEWNPRMAPYIYGEKNGRHILDLVQSHSLLEQVLPFLEKKAAQGKTFLFVGTKKQAAPLVAKTALACNSFYVNQRWLGGMLTNWQTIQKSLAKLDEYRKEEQRGDWNLLKKQEIARKKREKQRLEKYLTGVQNMSQLPGVVIIIGQPQEIHAVRECRQLGIPTITLLDSNCDPTLADWFIPANDDSVSAIRLLLDLFEDSIIKGQKIYHQVQSLENEKQGLKKSKKFLGRKNPSRTLRNKVSKSRSVRSSSSLSKSKQ